MADITKVLRDDHARIKRLLLRSMQAPEDLNVALDACDELVIHTTIEEELIYPAVRERIDERLADAAEDEHEAAAEIIGEIEDLEPGDPRVRTLMMELQRAVTRHIEREEQDMLPRIDTTLRDDSLELGRQAFALRQELLAQRAPRSSAMIAATVNTGWAGSREAGRSRNYAGNAGWGH